MKKIILSSLILGVMLATTGIVVAKKSNVEQKPVAVQSAEKQNQKFNLPENAKEVAPGVFYLGEDKDVDGKPVKGYAFVHYAKGHKPEVPETDNSTGDTCYDFIWEGISWDAGNVEDYVINPTNKAGLGHDGILNTFATSVSTWEHAGESTRKYNIIGDGFITDEKFRIRRLDGINSVQFGTLGRGIIGVNVVWTDRVSLLEWDQIYSNKFDWSLDCDAEDCTSEESLKMDFQNIATHELGHAVGLADLYNDACSDQTMYGYSWEGDTQKRDLASGDIAGIQELYGN